MFGVLLVGPCYRAARRCSSTQADEALAAEQSEGSAPDEQPVGKLGSPDLLLFTYTCILYIYGVCVYTNIYIYMVYMYRVYTYIYIDVCICTSIFQMYTYLCIYIYMYTCVCIHIYIYECIYIYIHASRERQRKQHLKTIYVYMSTTCIHFEVLIHSHS